MSLIQFPLPRREPLAYDHTAAEKAEVSSPPPQPPAAAEPTAKPISPVVLAGMVRFADFVLILLAGLTVHAYWISSVDGWDNVHLAALFAVPTVAVFFFQTLDIYNVPAFRSHVHQLARIAGAWTLVLLVVLALSFFAKHQNMYSRVWIGGWYASGMIVLFVWRIALAALVCRWADQGRLIRRVVIVGGGPPGEALVKAFGLSVQQIRKIIRRLEGRV